MRKNVDELIKVKEAAEHLKVSKLTVYKWVRKGWIPVCRLGPTIVRLYIIDVEYLKDITLQRKSDFKNQTDQNPGAIAQTLKFPSLYRR